MFFIGNKVGWHSVFSLIRIIQCLFTNHHMRGCRGRDRDHILV